MLSTYAKELKGPAWMGKITMPCFVLATITNLWGGKLSDRIGRPKTIAIGFLGGAVGMFSMVLVKNTAVAVLGAGLLGVMSALVTTSAIAWVGDMTGSGDRTRLYGQVFCGGDFGSVVALVLAGSLAQANVRPQWGFLVMGVLFVVSAIASLAIPSHPGRARTDDGDD
jgi:MFS family permease